MSITTVIDLIRHGEPVGGKMYRGHRDDPLSEAGWRQMRTAVGDHHPWQAVVSSTLLRCRAFAEELAQRHQLPTYFDARLIEIGFGAWEGRTAEELMREDPEAIARFWRDPVHFQPAGAEPLAAFAARIESGWKSVVEQHAGRHILLVCHAGVIRMILRSVLGISLDRVFRIDVPYAGISRIHIDGEGELALPRLIFHAGKLPA